MPQHPVPGWSYPVAEKVVGLDCGGQLGAIVIEADGSRSVYRWKLRDIVPLALQKIENVKAPI